MSQTIPNVQQHLDCVEKAFSTSLIPALTGKLPPNASIRDIYGRFRHARISQPIVDQICKSDYENDCECLQLTTKTKIKKEQQNNEKVCLENLCLWVHL